MVQSIRPPSVSQQPSSWPAVSPPAADSLREVAWTVSHGNTVLFISRESNYKIQTIFTRGLMSLNVSNSRFRKLVMTWMWRHYGVTLWRDGGGLDTMTCSQRQLATSTDELTLITTWLDCDKLVIWKIRNAGSRVSYGPYQSLEVPNHRIKS